MVKKLDRTSFSLFFAETRRPRLTGFSGPPLDFGPNHPDAGQDILNQQPVTLMISVLHPWQLLLAILSGWVNQRQQEIIEFQNIQITALMQKLGQKRLLPDDDQRRLLAVKGKAIGRKALLQLTTIVTPDTILGWHRKLVAEKWDDSQERKSVGRPRTPQEIVDLVLQFARENPSWGYDRFVGALDNLDHQISDQTVGNLLKTHGIEPAAERQRQTAWATFLKAHWDVLAAIDFTTMEVWTRNGLVTF